MIVDIILKFNLVRILFPSEVIVDVELNFIKIYSNFGCLINN